MLLTLCCQIEELPFNLKGRSDPGKSGVVSVGEGVDTGHVF